MVELPKNGGPILVFLTEVDFNTKMLLKKRISILSPKEFQILILNFVMSVKYAAITVLFLI